MKTTLFLTILVALMCSPDTIENANYLKARVSYSDYETLVKDVKIHRNKRLINFDKFYQKSKEDNVVILDTRSKAMFDEKHMKGAIHLNFSDFTQENLAKIIPDKNTTILIYCNNNFFGDDIYFASKTIPAKVTKKASDEDYVSLALNIPTYINLFGYGYKNVYELDELLFALDKRVHFERTAIQD
ncbi:rhodanese-like domain-containing protein [Psychroserpens sp. BH13MA-6]